VGSFPLGLEGTLTPTSSQHHVPLEDEGAGPGGHVRLLQQVVIDPPYVAATVRSDNETVLRRVVELLATFDAQR
jgi:hypothetical protein